MKITKYVSMNNRHLDRNLNSRNPEHEQKSQSLDHDLEHTHSMRNMQHFAIIKQRHVGLKKVKFTLEQAMKAQRRVDVQLYSFFNLCTRCCGWLTPRPGLFIPGKKWVPIVEEAVWAPTGFDPRTVQTAASSFIV